MVGWLAFAVMAIAALLVSSSSLDDRVKVLLTSSLIYLLPILLGVVGGIVAAAASRRHERHFWSLFAFALLALLVSEGYWTAYTTRIDPRGPQLPAPFEIPQAVAVLMILAVLVTMTGIEGTPLVERLRFYADMAAGQVIVFAAVYWLWTLPLFAHVPMGGMAVASIAAVYPVVGVTLLTTAGLAVLGWGAPRRSSWESLVVVAFVVYGLGLLTFPSWYASLLRTPVLAPLDAFTVVGGFGFYLLFMATVYRLTSGPSVSAVERWLLPELRPRWLAYVYPALISLALPVLVVAAMRFAREPGGPVLVASAMGLAIALLARSWLGGRELAYHRSATDVDPLSGAFSDRYLFERLAVELDDAAASGSEVAVVVADIDEFRSVNSVLGTDVGDRVLGSVARVLKEEAAANAAVCRLGGDEFAVVLPDTGTADALAYAHRIAARARVQIDEAAGRLVGVDRSIALVGRRVERGGDTIVAYTKDYATHSPFLSRYLDKVKVIPPPVHVPEVTPAEIAGLARYYRAGFK